MKVAMIVGGFPAASETFILNQITGLIDRGHSVDIYASFRRRVPFDQRRVNQYNLLDRTYYPPRMRQGRLQLILSGASVLAATTLKNPKILSHALTMGRRLRPDISWTLLDAARPILRHGPYDIIHCQFGPLGLQYVGLHKIGALRGAFISAFRGYDISLYVQKFGDGVYRRLFDAGDLFLPNSEYLKRRLIKFGCHEGKIEVHPSGIDCKRFVFAPRQFSPGDRIRIVTVGRWVEKKGVEYAIRAVAKLTKEIPTLEYLIVGDGILRESFELMIRALEVGKTIKLLGWKGEDEVAEILRTSHIMLAPSVTSTDGDQESIPNVLKEAMATGLPVVSTWHAGIPELVEDGVSGFLVPERNVDALVARLRLLISHPETWSAMGHAGRQRVEERYNIESLNDRLIDIYQTLPILQGSRCADSPHSSSAVVSR